MGYPPDFGNVPGSGVIALGHGQQAFIEEQAGFLPDGTHEPKNDKQIYIYIYTYITLHYITLHYITLHYITLHYIT